MLSLSKLGGIPIRLHRAIPDDAKLKQVTVKREPTGEWFATFGVQMDREPPEPPENPERSVGIDVGVLNYAHDTDGTAVGSVGVLLAATDARKIDEPTANEWLSRWIDEVEYYVPYQSISEYR